MNVVLLRGKHVSKDQKLLNTFQKINELNMNRAAENTGFVLRKATMFPATKEAELSVSSIDAKNRANELELLEDVMLTSPRRQSFALKETDLIATASKRRSKSLASLGKVREEPHPLEVNERESNLSQFSGKFRST